MFTPVPTAKYTGTKYEEHPVSSGPYKVVTNENDGEHLVLERNTYWSTSTDAERKAYPDRIDVKSGLDQAAKEWDSITQKLGVDNQRKAYTEFLKLPGATSKNTVSKLGLAVHVR